MLGHTGLAATSNPSTTNDHVSNDSSINVIQFNVNGTRSRTGKKQGQGDGVTGAKAPQCVRTIHMAKAEGYSFCRQSSSPETQSDPHLEEVIIKAELGNTKLIISTSTLPNELLQ